MTLFVTAVVILIVGVVYHTKARSIEIEMIDINPSMCTYIYHESGETNTLCVRDTEIDLECTHTIESMEPFDDDTVQYSIKCSKVNWSEVAPENDTTAAEWGPNGEGF